MFSRKKKSQSEEPAPAVMGNGVQRANKNGRRRSGEAGAPPAEGMTDSE